LKGKVIIVNRHYNIKVTAYSGYKANERPLSFDIDDHRIEVRDIISMWAEPEKDFFKIIADDNRVYTLSWDRKSDLWTIEKGPVLAISLALS
jgi:hypothetical protein